MYYRVDIDRIQLEYDMLRDRACVDGSGKRAISASEYSPEDGYALFTFEPMKGPELKLELQYNDMLEVRDFVHLAILQAEGHADARMQYLTNLREKIESEIVALDYEMATGHYHNQLAQEED